MFVSLATLLAPTILLATGCASSPASSGGKDASGATAATAVGGTPSLSYTVPQLMKTMDAGKKNGLAIKYTGAGASSSNMVAAVLSRDADFAFPASTTALDAIQEGSDLIIVASALKFASILGISTEAAKKTGVTADAPVQERIKALQGLKIATSPEGSGNNALLRQIVSAAGMNPDKDIKIIGVQDPSAIIGGIKQRRFDAGFYGSGVIEANIAAGEAELWISTARGDVNQLVGDQMGMVMVTSKRTLKSKPDLVSSMFDTVVDTEKAIAENPQDAGATLKKAWFPDLDQRVFDLAWGQAQHAYPTDGRLTKAQFDTLIKLLSRSGKSYDLNYADTVYEKARG
ncbi:ABC transporter substrate-binding protein [Actinomadura geliboluensis]|uniref:ABC transporter substrate-binding protein n=1 Tax=Actinomadura geliboluensis TaxID=882440 RepID=UPI00371046E0